MRVDHVPFGPFGNASEERACQHLSRRLMAEPSDARFVILTNMAHSITSGGQPDEIDLILVWRWPIGSDRCPACRDQTSSKAATPTVVVSCCRSGWRIRTPLPVEAVGQVPS